MLLYNEETQTRKRKGIQTEEKVELLEEKNPWEPKKFSFGQRRAVV